MSKQKMAKDSKLNANKKEESANVHTTSGSELEIEQRVLLKGNVMAARNSLLDFVQINSWIKKSNYEGIFNGMLIIFLMFLVHKPIVNYCFPMNAILVELVEDGKTN